VTTFEAGWDCHTHVFGPYDLFPLADQRSYSPPPASTAALCTHLDKVGLQNVVLVQPNSHGSDTRAMMSALTALGPRARAVTVIDPWNNSAGDLTAMRDNGIRGVRLNIHTAGSPAADAAAQALDRLLHLVRESGLHLQLFAAGTLLTELLPWISRANQRSGGAAVQVVVDHMGMVIQDGGDGLETARMLTDHGCWIKLSAPERMGVSPDDARVHRLVDEYATRAPDRILWGSDWPHSGLVHDRPITEAEPFRQVDDGARLTTIRRWLGDSLLERMLVVNPRELYH
jgi:predicted TIM-barrel fold metal-dependent hydrolase